MWRELMTPSHGGDRKNKAHIKPDNARLDQYGNTKAYTLQRLKENAPKLFECVVRGELWRMRRRSSMLRMMADENRDEFRADALVGVETIRAVVEAYAKGEIELEPVAENHVGKVQIYHLPGR